MRSFLGLMMMLLVSTLALAQTQQGYVKTKGRLGNNGKVIAGSRLSGATISVRGGNAVLSGKSGVFALAISGNSYYLQNVQKQGYVLADPDVLSKQYAFSNNPLVLVLETPDQQLDDKLAVERKIRRTLQRQLQEKETEIEALKEQQKLTGEEYRKQLQKIYAQQESNEKLISEMADRYSRMDFDEVDEFNRRINSLILEGKLTEADSLLNTKGDINSRAETLRLHQEANTQAEQEIKKKQKKLEKSKALTRKELEELAQDCYSKFEIFKMMHQNDSAAYYVELRSSLDSTNYEWVSETGSFMADYMADYSAALSFFQRALRIASSSGQSVRDRLGSAYLNIGGVYEEKGNYLEAQQYFRKALAIFLSENEKSMDVATCYNCLGSSLVHIENYDLALEYLGKALEIRLSLEGDQGLEAALSYNNIGSVHSLLGHYSEAIDCFRKALDIRLKYGDETETVAGSYHNIGSLMSRQGDYAKALEYFEKALIINKKFLGERHPHLSYLYNNLGYTYGKMGYNDKALDNYMKALNNRIRLFGELHSSLATTYNNIASVYKKNKDYNKAIEYYQKSIDVIKSNFGDKSAKLGTGYNNIGSLLIDQKDFSRALEYLTMAKDAYISSFGEDYPDLGVIYANIGRVYRLTEDYPQALVNCEKAMQIMTKANLTTPALGMNYGNLGNILFAVGNYPQSLDCFEKALQIMDLKLGKDHPTTKTLAKDMEKVKEKMEQTKK